MRHTTLRLVPALLVVPLLAAPAPAQPLEPRELLASQMACAATSLLGSETQTVAGLESAATFLQEAIRLTPDNVELWRMLREIALLSEREDLFAEAVDQIVRLDPADDVARLARVNLALERLDRVEQRVEAYHQLLAPENRARLGAPAASRLALDLALLERRHGDIDAFADALATAVAIDPANRTAAAIAAGYFRMNVDDPYAEAELLVGLLLADPTDITSQIALGQLLLDHAAYVGAERFYGLAIRNMVALLTGAPDDLVADHAIAQWGSDQAAAALRTIQDRQQLSNEMLRNSIREQNPDLDFLERAKTHAQISPTLATVRAAIHAFQEDEEASFWIDRAMESYEAAVAGQLGGDPPEPAEQARLRLEMAWLSLWLGGDAARARTHLERAERVRPLHDEAGAMFEGWIALAEGDAEKAAELLGALPPGDPATALGLARARLALGQSRSAARALLAAARAQPGSVLGIWAAKRLRALVGRPFRLSDTAGRLEDLIAGIPPYFDRYPDQPSLAVGLTVEPSQPSFGPFEPIIINIRVKNNSNYPLAIDRQGPIRAEVLLFITTSLKRIGAGETPPMVVDIDRRLRLEPQEEIVVPVDLRHFRLGEVLATRATRGTFVRVKGLINAQATRRSAIIPALLGEEHWTEHIRIEGVRVDPPWIVRTTQDLNAATALDTLPKMALVGQVLGFPLSQEAPPAMFKIMDDARQAFGDAYLQIDAISRAWLLTCVPPEGLSEPVLAMTRQSGDRTVQLAYLMYQLRGPDDPMLDAASRSEDPLLRRIADRSSNLHRGIFELNRRRAESSRRRDGRGG